MMAVSPVGSVSETVWEQAYAEYMEGAAVSRLMELTGIGRQSVLSRMARYHWAEQREAKRSHIPWQSNGKGSVHEVHVDEDVSEAVGLRKKHDKGYYQRLDKLLERIEHVETLILSQVEPMAIDYLSKAYDRLLERYRIVSGKSLPPTQKLSDKPLKTLPSTPILPLD